LFGPEAFVSPQPADRLFQRRRREAADDDAAGFGTRDQGCVRQHVEMLHDRWQRHGKRTGQVADGCAFPLAQLGYERAPRRIGERRENVIQIGALILNHLVNDTAHAKPCQASRRCGRPSANRRHCFRFGRRPIRSHGKVHRVPLIFAMTRMAFSIPCIASLRARSAGSPHAVARFRAKIGSAFRKDVEAHHRQTWSTRPSPGISIRRRGGPRRNRGFVRFRGSIVTKCFT